SAQETVFEKMPRPILARSGAAEKAQVPDRKGESQVTQMSSSPGSHRQFETGTNARDANSSGADSQFITVALSSDSGSQLRTHASQIAQNMSEKRHRPVPPIKHLSSRDVTILGSDEGAHNFTPTGVQASAITGSSSSHVFRALETATSDDRSQTVMESRILQ